MEKDGGSPSAGSGVLRGSQHKTEAPADEPEAPKAPPAPAIKLAPFDFVKETGDAQTRYYRAHDTEGVMYAGFYGDGRVRVADTARSFAGMVQNGHAHLLQIDTEDWCEMFVRTTPAGALQLELRDGPYDGRILTCEPCGVTGEA